MKMEPIQFAYWLQGFAELAGERPSAAQWEMIKLHLQAVFEDVIVPKPQAPQTPSIGPVAPTPAWPQQPSVDPILTPRPSPFTMPKIGDWPQNPVFTC